MRYSFFSFATAFALSLAASPFSATAQTLNKLNAGLWAIESTQKLDWEDMQSQMQALLEQIPEAQRQQFEQTLRQSGALPSENQSQSLKECLTPEMVEQEFEPQFDGDVQCDYKRDFVSASEARFTFSCSGADGNWKGQGRVWDLGAKHYKTSMQLAGKVDGHDMKMDLLQEGRWLGSDCQGLEPRH